MDRSWQRVINNADNLILPGDTGARLEDSGRIPILQPHNIWTPERERQIRDLRNFRAALELSRRRHRIRVPLCSTTFGGATVPPLFGGGGGGFVTGDIQIGSVGADYIGPAAGNPAPVTMPAASANIGDELWQIVHSSGTYANDPNWTQVIGGAAVLFNRFRLLRRTADGTASDDFILPITTLFVTAKQWSLQEVLPFDTFPSAIFQGGFLNTTSTLVWDVGFPPGTALTANLTRDPAAFVYGNFACQDRQQPGTVAPIIADSDPDGMETIVSIGAFAATGGAATDTELTLVKFQYLPVSVSYIEYTIGRTPGAPNTYAQWTQYQRLFIS